MICVDCNYNNPPDTTFCTKCGFNLVNEWMKTQKLKKKQGKQPVKQPKQKCADEMDFNEFVQWANEYAVEKFLESGLKGIKEAIHNIVNMSAVNKQFGGKKKLESATQIDENYAND